MEARGSVPKAEFRHWVEALEIQLEQVHGFVRPDLVLDKIMRQKVQIDAAAVRRIIRNINEDEDNFADSDFEIIDSSRWDFQDKTRFLYVHMLTALNTEPHETTLGNKSKNGLGLYSLVYHAVDAIPHNAEFRWNCQIQNLPAVYAPGTKMKDLYGFRLTPRKKEAEYKNQVMIKKMQKSWSRMERFKEIKEAIQIERGARRKRDIIERHKWRDGTVLERTILPGPGEYHNNKTDMANH